MKAITPLSFFCAAITLMAFSCGDQPQPAATVLPVVFSYDVLNAKGDTATTFREGDDVILRFIIKNPTDKKIYLSNYFSEMASSTSDAFSVDKLIRYDDNTEKWVRLGRACFPMSTLQIGAIAIAANKTIPLQFKWLEKYGCQADNQPLAKGRYRSQFSQRFTGAAGGEFEKQYTIQTFKINFTVE